MITPPSDPLFQYQWFLSNTGQSGGAPGSDIHVLPVWPDYTGKGVRVAIVDDGVQLDHPDLAANVDVAASWDAVDNVPGGWPVLSSDNHGTAVAGLVGALANNGVGGSGVAPDATLMAYRIDLSGRTDPAARASPAVAFQKALENRADIVSNSWGTGTAFANDLRNPQESAFYAYLTALAAQGRDGKGSIVLFANGNDGARNYDSNLDNTLNGRHVIAVGAVDDADVRTSYSTPGANLLISAPAGAARPQSPSRPGNGDLTTDRTGTAGYNTLAGLAGDYAYNFNGTSAATPVVSGVVALMLEANPNLGYRDVQEILAHSARFIEPGGSLWTLTHPTAVAWNGGSALFSRDYGFGEVDAHGAVRLAEVYPYLHSTPRSDANVLQTTASSGLVDLVLGPGNLVGSFTVRLGDGIDLNHLDLDLSAAFAKASELTVILTSPLGTRIAMVARAQNAFGDAAAWPEDGFKMGTNAFWGEASGGDWRVEVRIANGDTGGSVLSAALTGYGDATSMEKEFLYTDSFAAAINLDDWQQGSTARTSIAVQPGETAVIDAAAMSTNVTVNLVARQAVIAGQTITIDSDTRVTKVFTGDGNDSLIGDAGDNGLLAGRGVNTLDGDAGIDTALYIGSRSGYIVTYNGGVLTSSSLKGNSMDTAIHIEKVAFSEGTLFVQAASDAGLDIAAFYYGLLFRSIDADGYRYWTDTAAQGSSAESIGAAFQGSAEYINGAGKLGNAAYVDAVYQQMLHRTPDAAGAAYWTQQLASGAQTRTGLVVAIEHSAEYAASQLVGTFQAINDLGNLWA